MTCPPSWAQDDLNIEASEIKGHTGTELLARDAVLTYGDITLTSPSLLYDPQAGWVKASGGVDVSDGRGNALRTDLMDYFPQLGRAVAKGNVSFTAGTGEQLLAGLIRYEIESQAIFVEEGALLRDTRGNELSGASMSYLVQERTGTATDVMVTGGEDARGVFTAAGLRLDPGGYTLADARFTTCDIDDPQWELRVGELHLDGEDNVAAKNASMWFFGVPVFYMPGMSFSYSNERRSGFLAPRFRYRSGGEFNIVIPYYANLAPNYDATIEANLINGVGVLTDVHGRWLTPRGSGVGTLGYINDTRDNDDRWHWHVDAKATLGGGAELAVVGDWVSDDAFADDFLEVEQSSRRHFSQSAELSRADGPWEYGLGVLTHRTVYEQEADVERPYDSLPSAWLGWQGGTGAYDAEVLGRFDLFSRRDDAPDEGYRVHSAARLGRTDWFGFGRLRTEAGVAGSVYEVDESSWAVPYASAQVSKPFEGTWSLAGSEFRQVVEPRLYYGVVGSHGFTDVPVYDSARVKPNASDIYSVNSFVGGDRFDDTDVLVYGVDTRLWRSSEGDEVLTARLAQRYRFEDSQVPDGDESPPESGYSNLIAEGTLLPDRRNSLKGRMEWNPDSTKVEQFDIEAQHLAGGGDAYYLSYTRNVAEGGDDDGQAGLRLVKNLTGNWQFASDLNYDINDRQVSEVFGGLRFVSTCRCWGFDILAEREAIADGDRTTYLFQVSLDGLGSFGVDRFDKTAERIRAPL